MLANLHVWHLRKSPDSGRLQGSVGGDCLSFETCQRWVAVACDGAVPPTGLFAEHYEGVAAYAFMLRLCCGLESRLVGETEVLGQVKEAWAAFSPLRSRQSLLLAPIFQKIFEDAKTVRRTHLQNLGQASYGSLLRRILSQAPLKRPVLVLGAGSFAQSLLPWLAPFDVHVSNRTQSRALALADQLQNPVVPWEQALESAATLPCHVVGCVPGGDEVLRLRLETWARQAPRGTLFFDLGEPALWNVAQPLPEGVTRVPLEGLYDLQKKEESLEPSKFSAHA